MAFRILADATVVLHLGFVLFVVLGGVLVARWRGVAWVHLPAAGWGTRVEFAGWVCPLTPLENWLRQQGGGPVYTATFIEHYLVPVLYPSSLSRELQVVLGSLVVLVNAAVYLGDPPWSRSPIPSPADAVMCHAAETQVLGEHGLRATVTWGGSQPGGRRPSLGLGPDSNRVAHAQALAFPVEGRVSHRSRA